MKRVQVSFKFKLCLKFSITLPLRFLETYVILPRLVCVLSNVFNFPDWSKALLLVMGLFCLF